MKVDTARSHSRHPEQTFSDVRFEGGRSRAAFVRDGDVVVGMDGDFNLVYWTRGPAALNQRLCLLRSNGQADTRFLAYALPSHLKVINDLTYSTTVKHLASGQVRGIKMLAPDVSEQRAIADLLDRETARIDALMEEQQRLIELLRAAAVGDRISGWARTRRRSHHERADCPG